MRDCDLLIASCVQYFRLIKKFDLQNNRLQCRKMSGKIWRQTVCNTNKISIFASAYALSLRELDVPPNIKMPQSPRWKLRLTANSLKESLFQWLKNIIGA